MANVRDQAHGGKAGVLGGALGGDDGARRVVSDYRLRQAARVARRRGAEMDSVLADRQAC
jgi:hypothetical protein